MKSYRREIAVVSLLLSLLFQMPSVAMAQETKLLTSGNGDGVIKVGREQFKLTSVVIKLLDDRRAEITLVSEITIFVTGNWSERPGEPKAIDLQITGGATGRDLEGSGRLLLRDDQKSIDSLKLEAVNRNTKRNIQVSFTAK